MEHTDGTDPMDGTSVSIDLVQELLFATQLSEPKETTSRSDAQQGFNQTAVGLQHASSNNLIAPSLYTMRVDNDSGSTLVDEPAHDTISWKEEQMAAMLLAQLEEEMPELSEQDREFALQVISAKIQGQDIAQFASDSDGVTLGNAGTELFERFEATGDAEALTEGISLLRASLEHFPHGHRRRDVGLNNLANALLSEFEITGNSGTLIESIELYRESFVLTPPSRPDRYKALNNLATSLLRFFEHEGNRSALTESISLLRESLDLQPHGSPLRDASLNNLASSLVMRYELEGDKNALTEAISLYRESLLLRPHGHPLRHITLNNLANSLHTFFQHEGDKSALRESIELHRESIRLRPDGHPHHLTSLDNLANSLTTYFELEKKEALITESIALHKQVLELTPTGHPKHGDYLHNFAIAYLRYFENNHDEESLVAMLNLREKCLDVWPKGHPRRHLAHFYLAHIQLQDTPHFNWEEALDHILSVVEDNAAPVRSRLRVAVWVLPFVENATALDRDKFLYSHEALTIYISAVRLLPRVAHLGLDVVTRLHQLSGSEQLCRTGAARALLVSQPQTALELLEEGRNVFWQRALQLRSSALDNLPEKDRSRLVDMFQILEQDSFGSKEFPDKASMERQIANRRRLSDEAESLIEEIRTRPGFERFLSTPGFTQLCEAATNGPAVILNEHSWGTAALIVNADWPEKIRHVPLGHVSLDKLQKLASKVVCYDLRGEAPDPHIVDANEDSNVNRAPAIDRGKARAPLAELWKDVVKPVIDKLGLQVAHGRNRPRLHWCPSGRFNLLPLHAAGIYDGRNRVCVSDYVVSSYTPSLSALIKARKDFTPILRQQIRALVAAEPAAPDLEPLPSVEEEIQIVAGLVISVSGTIVNDLDTAPTTQSLLDAIPSAHFFHLSCHGQQHPDPLQSSFALRDGELTISSLMKLNLPNAIFAFLSACQTAKGDKEQPDQTVHLAASMLFCGFPSVLATMWDMHDIDGPFIAQRFYESLFKNETIGLDDIAYALDEAVGRLRETGAPPIQWATFLHMGG